MPIPREFLQIMACTFCRSELREEGETLVCTNAKCNLRFPVRENIPVMLLDEALRPCPSCSASREFKNDTLVCPKCGQSFK